MQPNSNNVPPPRLKEYVFTEKLGSGSYATVYKAWKKGSIRKVVAIKCIERHKLSQPAADNLLREIAVLKHLNHRFIVQLLDFQWDTHFVYLIMEYCAGGDLSRYIRTQNRVPESLCRRFLQQLGSALLYLRTQDPPVSHFDLKPQNILLTSQKNPCLKVADFGFAQFLSAEAKETSLRGSPLYMGPEILLKGEYNAVADLWSVGVILYECLFGAAPYASKSIEELLEKIRKKKPIVMPRGSNISHNCSVLLEGLLKHDPLERMGFDEFFSHGFLDLEHFPTEESFKKGTDLAKQAVKEEKEGNLSSAQRLYCEAVQYLLPFLNDESFSERKASVQQSCDAYLKRAAEIKSIIQGASEDTVTTDVVDGNKQISEVEELDVLSAATPELKTALEIGYTGVMYEKEGHWEAARGKLESALATLLKLLGKEPVGRRRDLIRKQTSVVSLAYAQSEILQREVYLFERLDPEVRNDPQPLRHLKCIVFLRPTKQNVELLSQELRSPRFGVYYVYWSNAIAKSDIKMLAEADEQEVVREVQEYFADFLPVCSHLYSFGIKSCAKGLTWEPVLLQRCTQGLMALLLSLRCNPVIRYHADSPLARRMADAISYAVKKESGLFNFHRSDSVAVLLIVDRRSDPITPLLSQWTYQAMVHELIGINNNRVNLSKVPKISKELQELVLSTESDEFYASNIFLNLGEIGQTIKELMQEFQAKAQSRQSLESISDMKAFVENYPQFKKLSGTVSKHVTVVGELSRLVELRKLLEVSEVEQEITCHNDHSHAVQMIRRLLSQDKVQHEDAARIVMLYALKYSGYSNNVLAGFMDALTQRGATTQVKEVQTVLDYGGTLARSQEKEQFGTQDAVKITKRFFQGLKGVENVYTQHSPVLKETVEDLLKGRLKDSTYPCVDKPSTNFGSMRVQDVIVFMVGGATYEEYFAIHQVMKANPGCHVVLGGSNIHNSQTFIEEVQITMQGLPGGQFKRHI